jgi:hypothetical protein
MPNTSGIKRGWNWGASNGALSAYANGLEAIRLTPSATGCDFYMFGDTPATNYILFDASGPTLTLAGSTSLTVANGLTVTAGGATVTAGGLTVTAGGATITAGGLLVTAGRIREVLTPTDVDAQSHTLTVANIVSGIVVHTTTTGAGTVTTDTAAHIVAGATSVGALTADGQCLVCYYINDGNQTATFAGGDGVTVADTAQTVGENESAILLFRRASATTVTLYIIGA